MSVRVLFSNLPQELYLQMKTSKRAEFTKFDEVETVKKAAKELAATATAIINRHNATQSKALAVSAAAPADGAKAAE